MRTFAELRALSQHNVNETRAQLPDVGTLVLMWNKGEATTQVAIAGEVEAQRDMVRMLREIADKLEKSKGKLVIDPN